MRQSEPIKDDRQGRWPSIARHSKAEKEAFTLIRVVFTVTLISAAYFAAIQTFPE